MNRDEVKEKLLGLHKTKEDFTVVFTGKKNGRVNGLYKPLTKEIAIHNRNFGNDNLLMYTAIHELAHHVCHTEYGQNGVRSHTALFWGTFHDLLDTAEKSGIYAREEDGELRDLAEKAKAIDREIAKLQRELGEVLLRIDGLCKEKGVRREDVYERDIRLSRKTAGNAVNAALYGIGEGYGQDVQNMAAGIKNGEEREETLKAGRGKSIAQIKLGMANKRKKDGEDGTERLIAEKNRLERTIRTLEGRLLEITEKLSGYGGKAEGTARRSADAMSRIYTAL